MMFIPDMLARASTGRDAQNSQMIKWYFDMFEYVAGYPKADRIIRNLLGPGGALERRGILTTRHGSEMFLALSKADHRGALSFLERFASTGTKNEAPGHIG